MPSDVPSIRYILPKFSHGYNALMKTLTSSLKFASSDVAQFRLHVIEYGKKHGVKAALEAFHVGKSTYFEWQQALTKSQGKLIALVPKSTRPHTTRTMVVDERLLEFIRSVRETYGRVGKDKLKVLVAAYAQSLGIHCYGSTKIGIIIKRNRYFFDSPKQKHRRHTIYLRVRKVGKDVKPGYLEMDSVVVYVNSTKLVFVTIIDVVTKVAFAKRVANQTAAAAVKALHEFCCTYAIPIHAIQTDNGSEFLGQFHAYLEAHTITHLFIYPHSPKVNGVIERFNRTIQEEFIERCEAYWHNYQLGDQKLLKYLAWYNTKRPHTSLNYLTPLEYAQRYH